MSDPEVTHSEFIKVDGVDMTFSRGEEEVHALRGLDLSIPRGRLQEGASLIYRRRSSPGGARA